MKNTENSLATSKASNLNINSEHGEQEHSKESVDRKPLITVITIVYNGKPYLEETILSIISQTYDNVEYIIIDGDSSDGTLEIIKKYDNQIDYWISEKDNGIYNAMNKGINLAAGEWICMMNAGDIFYDNHVLENIFLSTINADLIYSDTWMKNKGLFHCDITTNRIVHQSLVYKKKLHEEVGLYLEYPKITISDYIFFQQCKDRTWYKTSFIISVFDPIGVSANLEHYKQKVAVDIMFDTTSRFKGSMILLLHPLYHKIKRLFSAK